MTYELPSIELNLPALTNNKAMSQTSRQADKQTCYKQADMHEKEGEK